MATLGITFHFGFNLVGTTAQLQYYDASTTTTHDITIPAGMYFFRHDTTAKDIRTEITTLINASLPGTPSFSLTTSNDRQLTWDMDAASDYINLVDTGNGDELKLAAALGIYLTDDLTHFQTNNLTDGYVTPNVLASWYATGGRVYETESLDGFDITPTEIYETEGGGMSYAAGTHKAVLGPVKWTGIEGDAVRGGWPYATQTTPGTTINADWTTSIWRAANPEYNTPVFYAEIGATPDAYEFALRDKLQRESARQITPGWTQNFNLTTDLIRLESF